MNRNIVHVWGKQRSYLRTIYGDMHVHMYIYININVFGVVRTYRQTFTFYAVHDAKRRPQVGEPCGSHFADALAKCAFCNQKEICVHKRININYEIKIVLMYSVCVCIHTWINQSRRYTNTSKRTRDQPLSIRAGLFLVFVFLYQYKPNAPRANVPEFRAFL